MAAGQLRVPGPLQPKWGRASALGIRPPLLLASTLSAALALKTPRSATGQTFCANCQNASATGWSVCRAKACAAPTLFSPASGPRLKSSAATRRSRPPRVAEVALAEYLEKVWEVVGRSALAQVLGTADARARNGAAGALEEDARLTALFLWTLQSTDGEAAEDSSDEVEDEEDAADEDEDEEASRGKPKGFTLVFDVVRRFAQPLGIDLPKWEGRIIDIKKGVVRLLPIAERAKQLFGEDGAQAIADAIGARGRSRTEPASRNAVSRNGGNPDCPRARAAESRRPHRREGSDQSLTAVQRGHDPRPRPRRHAAPGGRPHQRAARPAQGRAGARLRLPAPRQCALSPLPEGQRGKAPARRDAARCSEVTTCFISLTAPTWTSASSSIGARPRSLSASRPCATVSLYSREDP